MILSLRDKTAVEKIIRYCDEADETNLHFGNTKEKLSQNNIYKNALSMCILQIGELTTVISEEFKKEYSDIPWSDIKKMRNIAAHRYGEFSTDFLWDTVTDDIPVLRNYCRNCLAKSEAEL